MNKSTSNILMVVGFLVIIVAASALFARKTEAYQNAPMPNLGAPEPILGAPMPNLGAPEPILGAPMPNLVAPEPILGAPMPNLGTLRPILGAPMPNLGAPVSRIPFIAGPKPAVQKVSQSKINALMGNIQTIDTNLIRQSRNMMNAVSFMKDLLIKRRQSENALNALGKQSPPVPQEVMNLIKQLQI